MNIITLTNSKYAKAWPYDPGLPTPVAGQLAAHARRHCQGRQVQHDQAAEWSGLGSRADITIAEATSRVLGELTRMDIDRQDVIISTNLALRLDGVPRSAQAAPRDAGAAVYWENRKGERRVMAIDQYSKVEDNLAAIAATLDAMRAIERHGGAQILDRAFTGFTALAAPSAARTWREVMTFGESTPTREQLRQRYRELARIRHPDRAGGSDAAMSEFNVALAEAEREVGA